MKYFAAFLSAIFGIITFLFMMAYLEMSIGLIQPVEIPIVLDGTLEYFEIKRQLISQDIFFLLLIIVSFILFARFYALYHKLNKKKKDTKAKDSIKEPFVLYLRSFVDDKKTSKLISLNDVHSEEEVLVEIMSDIAPVYAIGDPKDKKMPLGASRIYVDDASWKDVVSDLMKRAAIVVLRLGKTDSFWWEVETAVKNIPLQNLMFVVPESKTFSNVSLLYKILLEHNVDIKALDITIEKKNRGSISSFLYFDNEGLPIAKEVIIPRFTRFILSYENILRNALSGFREKFGLKKEKKNVVRFARIMEIFILLSITFIGTGNLFSDMVSLKYQMPYEFLEKCVNNHEFVKKYSDEINGTNLVMGLAEAQKGMLALENDKYKLMFLLEAKVIYSMSSDELEHLTESYKNMLLMAKKYLSENDYESYIDIFYDAALTAIMQPQETEHLIQEYKQKIVELPQWINDIVDENYYTEGELLYILSNNIIKHIDDPDIVDILKSQASKRFSFQTN